MGFSPRFILALIPLAVIGLLLALVLPSPEGTRGTDRTSTLSARLGEIDTPAQTDDEPATIGASSPYQSLLNFFEPAPTTPTSEERPAISTEENGEQDAHHQFGNSVAGRILAQPAATEDELATFTDDPDVRVQIGERYVKTAQKLEEITAPDAFRDSFMRVLNAHRALGEALLAASEAEWGRSAIEAYNQTAIEYQTAISDFAVRLKVFGAVFEPHEPGYLFTRIAQ